MFVIIKKSHRLNQPFLTNHKLHTSGLFVLQEVGQNVRWRTYTSVVSLTVLCYKFSLVFWWTVSNLRLVEKAPFN